VRGEWGDGRGAVPVYREEEEDSLGKKALTCRPGLAENEGERGCGVLWAVSLGPWLRPTQLG
jgi:hypothetical protein